jgi:hypothetical protein
VSSWNPSSSNSFSLSNVSSTLSGSKFTFSKTLPVWL